MKLLTVSRLQERKNHMRVVNSVMRLIQSEWIPDLEYDIVGSGQCMEALRVKIERYGLSDQIRIHPHVIDEQLKEFYEECDVFILPSLSLPDDVEGFGLVYLEAGQYGKPVIAGDKGGSTDAVIHNETGILVNAESEDSIAYAINFLYSYPEIRESLGKGNKSFVERFTWENQAQKIEEVFYECQK